jgi:predicted dehydrogenase
VVTGGIVKPVRIGIVGIGNMGRAHVQSCLESDAVDLVAVCDLIPERVSAATEGRDGISGFTESAALIEDGGAEAVLIATPHYAHVPIAIDSFAHGLHVLCEKPIGVHVADVQMILDAYALAREENPDLLFGAMFQQRTLSHWQKIHDLITEGSLGRLIRATWIITSWFRTQAYYDSSAWRATWKGEGGGVLLNQCPHNLDLYQWLVGMPDRVHGVVSLGQHHRIEVEDEASAIFSHPDGMTGHFITSTAESPGTNRLEIVGENGRLVYEDNTLHLDRNEDSMLERIRTSRESFDSIPVSREDLTPPQSGGEHREVIERFAGAVRGESALVAKGEEGLHSVMLANAILLSHYKKRPVDLPLNPEEFSTLLENLVAESTLEKPDARGHGDPDMDRSY